MPTNIPVVAPRTFCPNLSEYPKPDVFPTADDPDFLVLISFTVIEVWTLSALTVLLPISGDLSAVPFGG